MTREEAIVDIRDNIKPVVGGISLDIAIKALEQQPKTGHWIRMKAYGKWGCSECDTVFRFTFKEHDYCPNCGAKMEADKTENEKYKASKQTDTFESIKTEIEQTFIDDAAMHEYTVEQCLKIIDKYMSESEGKE